MEEQNVMGTDLINQFMTSRFSRLWQFTLQFGGFMFVVNLGFDKYIVGALRMIPNEYNSFEIL